MDWVKKGHRKGANTNNVSATVSIKNEEWKEVGLLVIIPSIWALIRTYRYKEPVDNDLFGIIIAILAILVTVLIGWNIYAVLDLIGRVKSELNNSKNIIDSDLARFKEESNSKINYESNKNLHITFGMIGKAMLENDNIPSAFNFLVLAAWQANKKRVT